MVLLAYSKMAYAKPNFAVVANGAEHSELSKWVGEFFTDSEDSPSSKAPLIDNTPSKYYGGEERIAHDSGNSMVLAFPGSSSFTGQSYKPEISVLAALLGGQSSIKWSPGFSLLSKATEAFPGAHIQTTSAAYSDAGLLCISITGKARQVAYASKHVVDILKQVASGNIGKEDIKKAVASARFKALETGQNIAAGLELTGAGLINEGKAHQIDEVGKGIDGVTEDQVKKVSNCRPSMLFQITDVFYLRRQRLYWTGGQPYRPLGIFSNYLLLKILDSMFNVNIASCFPY